MKYRLLGSTGVRVSELSFGCMTFGQGGMFGIAVVPQTLANEMVSRCIEAGVNLFDTADVYSQGVSEEILGNALRGRRDGTLIATKVGARMTDGPNDIGATRAHILRSAESSLRRLKTDYIDLYQLHTWDEVTPLEETLSALDDLGRRGKVRYIGCPNYAGWQITKSLWLAERHKWQRFQSMQMEYNLLVRDIEREHIPLCLDQGLSVLVWSPLMGGFLTGKFRRGQETDRSWRRGDPENFLNQVEFLRFDEGRGYDILQTLDKVAAEHGVSVVKVALAWLLTKRAVASVIIGAKTMDQLSENLGAGELMLTPKQVVVLDECSAVPAGYPYAMATFMRAGR